jgi:hypothetical protein
MATTDALQSDIQPSTPQHARVAELMGFYRLRNGF